MGGARRVLGDVARGFVARFGVAVALTGLALAGGSGRDDEQDRVAVQAGQRSRTPA